MSAHIESLEARRFLSASSLSADEAALSAAISGLTSLGSSDAATIRNDLVGHSITAADKALGVKWAKGVDVKYKLLVKADSTGAALVNKDVALLDAASSSKLHADIAKLQAAANKALAALIADCTALHAADVKGLTPIAAAFPGDTQLETSISTIEANNSTALAAIRADATTAFSTDVTDIVTSFS